MGARRSVMRWAGLAVAPAALLMVGAASTEQAPTPTPTPTLWEVTTSFSSKDMPSLPPNRICKGAPTSKQAKELVEALKGAGGDCKITHLAPEPDGFAPYEADCGLGGEK